MRQPGRMRRSRPPSEESCMLRRASPLATSAWYADANPRCFARRMVLPSPLMDPQSEAMFYRYWGLVLARPHPRRPAGARTVSSLPFAEADLDDLVRPPPRLTCLGAQRAFVALGGVRIHEGTG